MGSFLLLVCIMLLAGLSLAKFLLLAILCFLLLTGPTATYSLAYAALLSGIKPDAQGVEEPE